MPDRNQKKQKQQKKKRATDEKDRIDSMVDAGSGFTQNNQ